MKESRPRVAVIDYGMGNLRSVCKAWEHVGGEVRVVDRSREVSRAQILVFPGQGAITGCMSLLRESGLGSLICDWIGEDKPYFGICLGLQVLFEHSEEGNTKGLGIFPGSVKRFDLPYSYKIPHMGWNSVHFRQDREVNAGLNLEGEQFYFVHSYHVVPKERDLVLCETEYGYPFCSGIARGRCLATQFHPEKSQAKGLHFYKNFLEWVRDEIL
jgi:glutamine amidotransferase